MQNVNAPKNHQITNMWWKIINTAIC